MEILNSIKNLLFPSENICLFCRENPSYNYDNICTTCIGLVEFANKEIKLSWTNLGKVYYSVLYNRFIRDYLHRFKFEGKSYLYKPFGEILLSTIEINELKHQIDAIAFVPIHRRKEAIRGYNQSQLLGKYIANRLVIPLLNNHLLKIKWTKDQNKLGKIDRRDNLISSFKSINIEDFKGKEILLIDDIITTGTTMEECSKVLIENGAKKIHGLALTSSMKM